MKDLESQRAGRQQQSKAPSAMARAATQAQLLDLQKSAGNKAVSSLIASAREHPAAGLSLQRRKGDAAGVVDMAGDTITVGKNEVQLFSLQQGVADNAIGKEIDRSIAAVQQGHRQGLANFRTWYRGWEHAKDDSSSAMAAKICGFLLEKGLDIIFPEEEVFYVALKTVAKLAFDKAVDHLGETEKGDINAFLDNLQAVEEAEITKLLDTHDKFINEHGDVMRRAEMEFIIARDAGWESTDKLPPAALDILHGAGIGLHGENAATIFSERWLSAHIESVFREDASVMAGAGPLDVGLMAQISALRQMQRTTGTDYRERIWDLEQGLPGFFRMMVDINSEHFLMMKIRLGIDEDDARAIARSRNTVGPFNDPHELVTRKLLSEKDYRTIASLIVAH